MGGKTRTPVIIDTDPGVDDTLAILLAIASPELEILAYIISFGNTDVHAAYANIYKLYQAIGRHITQYPEDEAMFPNFSPTVPPLLAVGPEGPLGGGRHYAQYFHGRDGLSNITERHPDLNVDFGSSSFSHNFEPVKESGVEVALCLLESYPDRSITYVTLGPMTNLAQLMREHRQTVVDKIGRVIAMAGAVDVPGNTTSVAEFNVYADPYAAKELLVPTDPTSGFPLERLVLVPLDITTIHELPFPYYCRKVDPAFESTAKPSNPNGKSPIVHFTSSVFERTREIMVDFGKDALELHDIVAIWCAIENPPEINPVCDFPGMSPGWAVAERTFDIERTGEITRGMFVTDRRDENTAYAPGLNRAEVQVQLDLLQLGNGVLESTALPARVELEDPALSAGGPDEVGLERKRNGVGCLVETPGPSALLHLLTRRVWGFSYSLVD
ncbi:nucleoside hydrolase [Suillus paluster]|uniref:nucleoside hydrolase n=1 Tax=Suillus paluster TaxID=48578 RepID=UPI001B86F155|nr:nucleoside hydrolase [Suillus paluster]KAG1751646.1 nucleoside hydrolase [Suillus paluster]